MSQALAILGGPAVARPFTSWPVFGEPEEQRLLGALRSGKWGKLNGPEVVEFEQRFAAMHGAKHGIGVVNGTVSLRVALMAAGIKAEDEVIVPPYTFLATATAVVEANAVPVFADIDLETFNLDPKAVEAAITPRTRAIMPVHIAGQPADMDALMGIAKQHKLVVIEDAAHAHAALYRQRPVGSIGHMGSFSFQSSKNLTCGEGGIITTTDDALAEACRSIHNCGRITGGLWYEHHVMSANYRLGEFQGAVLNAQLDRLEAQTQTRDRNGQYLAGKLSRLPGVHPQKRPADCTRHSYHLFLFRIDAAAFGAPRQAVLQALQAEGVPASGGYALPLYRQPLFLNRTFGPYLPNAPQTLDYGKVSCPNCEKICGEQGAWFEQSLFLGPQNDMDDVANAFEKVHQHREALTRWAKEKISMKVGTAQVDITPQSGVELSGFAARVQPSTGVLDPLFAKALYLADGTEQVLWIHCDLVGFDREIVLEFRDWGRQRLGLADGQVMLSATHTHSGPCTIRLHECGSYDAAYVKLLQGRLREAAEAALAQTEDCDLAATEGQLNLAVDRRQQASKHTDPRVAALGFRRNDGTFKAVAVNYPMHPVALGSSNRQISADMPGQAALRLSRQLPGNPAVLVTNGACGNLNPPAENVPFAQIEAWGGQIADAVAARLTQTPPTPRALFRVAARIFSLPMDALDVAGIEAFARKALLDKKSLAEWGDKYRRTVEHWRSSLVAAAQAGRVIDHRDAELFALRLGDVILLGANAEVFSEFTDWLRAETDRKVYVVGYANGDLGYLPTQAAYAEGGYEVEVAHLFYGGFRPKAGGLELLAREAKALLRQIAG